MGLYLKIQDYYDRNENLMLILFDALIDKLKKYFKFKPTSKYILWHEDYDEKILKEYNSLNVKNIFTFIENHRDKIREKIGKFAHYTISIEGVILLDDEIKKTEYMIVDIFGTCTGFKDTYGNVWVNFYNTSKKWQTYFIGKSDNVKKNRKKLYSLMNDLKIPDFRLYSIFFSESNIVFDLLNKAYYLYFREYKYFLEYILKIIKDRLTEKNLEYENILISERKRHKLTDIKNDLKLYDPDELISIIDRHIADFSNKYEDFLETHYKKGIIYSTGSAVEIKERNMNPRTIRNALTDYLGNFMSTLDETLPKYKDFEKRIQQGFTTHSFEPEIKKKQSRF